MSTIIAGTLLRPADGTATLAPGWLRVDEGRIAEVGEGECPHTPDFTAGLVSPGFVDTHLHLPQFDSIGADGLRLLDWLDRVIFPAEARWADVDHAAEMVERVVDQLLSFGTIGFAGYATVHHDSAVAALEVCRRRGMRAVVGQVLMDQHSPAELERPTAQLLDECVRFLAVDAGPRVAPGLNPRFALTCTMELMAGVGELAARHGCFVQTHLAETRPECARASELFGGLGYTEIYRQAGLCTPRTLFAHGIYLDADERRMLAESGAIVAHCPTANVFLQSGAMDREALLADGVAVSLGSDVAGGWERSMVRVARAMIDVAKGRGATPPSSGACWWQITAGNAGRLGWDCGRLEAGQSADVLLIEPDIRWRDAVDPLGALLYGWDDRWITGVVLDGAVQEP